MAIEIKRNPRMRDEDLSPLQAFGEEYPMAKRFVLHAGEERRHHAGIEIIPLAEALPGLESLIRAEAL